MDGSEFPVVATLPQFYVKGRVRHTLILRNENELLEAAQKIRSLAIRMAFLKEELHELQYLEPTLLFRMALNLWFC